MTESRDRIVAGAADMLRRRGLHATSIREVARHADAPLGSTYHYFPGGKQQLVTEAIQWAGGTVAGMLERKLAAGPVAGLVGFLALWRQIVVDSDYLAGCPVLAVAIEEPGEDEQPLATAAQIFATWETLLTDSLYSHGADAGQARQLATLVVAAVEGAVALCRASRGITPLDDVAAQLKPLVIAAVSG